ncbi:hypothetical protein LR48_Vigan106s000300 [Vigna angularis]|uniref:Putative plant transposon protein domain-containing protein n=1 Tax=Phaseolus angularis TaxID=3914 RepID=A0A0L9T5T4_PHAAN|nr:hypothetical protein LR48_Vigan106s000300 [Vigna angularis]
MEAASLFKNEQLLGLEVAAELENANVVRGARKVFDELSGAVLECVDELNGRSEVAISWSQKRKKKCIKEEPQRSGEIATERHSEVPQSPLRGKTAAECQIQEPHLSLSAPSEFLKFQESPSVDHTLTKEGLLTSFDQRRTSQWELDTCQAPPQPKLGFRIGENSCAAVRTRCSLCLRLRGGDDASVSRFSECRVIFLYCVLRGLIVNIGQVIANEIKTYASSVNNKAPLGHPSLITHLYELAGAAQPVPPPHPPRVHRRGPPLTHVQHQDAEPFQMRDMYMSLMESRMQALHRGQVAIA